VENEILDHKAETEKRNREGLLSGYIALALLAAGLLLRYMEWPGSSYPILASFGIMIIRYAVLFVQKKKQPTDWLFLAGHILLGASAGLHFSASEGHPLLFIAPALCYILGIL
jgi:uncharacterized membrane protein AbrB (regulator of aidB expression)